MTTYKNYRKHWSEEDTKQFIKDWTDDKISIGTIIKKYERPYSSLVKKASKLGLEQRHNYSEFLTVATICEEMQVNSRTVLNVWMRNHGLKYKQSKTAHKDCLVSQDDLLDFLEKNQDLYDASKISEYLFPEEPTWLKDKRRRDLEWYPSRNKENWEPEEDAQLERMFKRGKSDEEIGIRLKRTSNMIKYRRQLLKLSRSKWNKYELDILIENSKYMTISELAKMLPLRTEQGISLKLLKMGLEYHWVKDMCKQKVKEI